MKDTTTEAEKIMREKMQQKTPQERLILGCSMFDFSRELVLAGILKNNPHLSPSEIKAELFAKFYEQDFSSQQQKSIKKHF